MAAAYEKLKIHRDNRGEALAMVLVIIAFISILAGVLMFVAYAGYQMRTVDRQGKDNFYTAETVLDEINVGLQGEISKSLAKAYEEVMINYASYPNATERNKALRTLYFDELKKNLRQNSDGTASVAEGYYNIDKIRDFLSEESKGDTGNGADGTRDSFEHGASYGAIVESNIGGSDSDPLSFQMEANNTRLLLKDLKVSYVNEIGYISIISTDIRIDLPSFNFAQAAELPALDSCSMIADDTLYMGNMTAGGSIVVKGDAYAGQMFIGEPQNEVRSALDRGNVLSLPMLSPTNVSFENAAGADTSNMSLVVSRQDIEVNKGSTLETDNVELWGQNLILNSAPTQLASDTATARLDGSTNLKDDLTLSGTGSVVSLSGEYYGFSYLAEDSGTENTVAGDGDSEDDTDSSVSVGYDASSAIVINGRDSTLDLSGLQRLTISGRAYIATTKDSTDVGENDWEKTSKVNAMMGESVAVKSNQLIYLVPGEALGCRIEKDKTIGESEFNCNPLTLEQYEQIITHPDEYLLLDGDRQISVLDNRKLKEYINQETVAGGGAAYVPEVVFRHTNGGTTLVYCYLRFADEDAANRYFRDYYGVNAEYVDQYTRLYAKDIKMLDSQLYLNIAGNMLVYGYGSEDAWSVVSSEDSTGNISQTRRISTLKENTFYSLSAKLVRTSTQLTDVELGQTAFNNIIDEVEVENILDAVALGAVQDETTVGIDRLDDDSVMITNKNSSKSIVLTKKDNFVVDRNSSQIVVSLGNVTVTDSYKGLIIAKGNITVEASGAITLEPIDIDSFSDILLTKVNVRLLEEEGSDAYYLMNIFTDGINYAASGNTSIDEGTSRVSLVDLISYERWLKK